MKKTTFSRLAGLFVLLGSLSALATPYNQTVVPAVDAVGTLFAGGPSGTPFTTSVGGGRSFVFYGRYIADLDKTTGVGLNIAFDGTKILNVAVDTVLTKRSEEHTSELQSR